MGQQKQLEDFIQENDWNVDYHNATAKNIFGTEYTVKIQERDGCFDLSNVKYGSKEITLKMPCDIYQQQQEIGETRLLSQILAHELGHSETYGISCAALGTIAIVGITKAIKRNATIYLLYTALAVVGYKATGDECLAEIAAHLIHGSDSFSAAEKNKDSKDLITRIMDEL